MHDAQSDIKGTRSMEAATTDCSVCPSIRRGAGFCCKLGLNENPADKAKTTCVS